MEEPAEQAPENVTAPVKEKRNWGRIVLYFVILFLVLSAIVGIFASALSIAVDPESIKPPVITKEMVIEDQKPVAPMMTEKPAPSTEIEAEPKIEVPQEDNQTDAPLELPSQKNDKVLTPEKNIAPQSMIEWKKPVGPQPIAKINGQAPQIAIIIDDMGLNMRNSRTMSGMNPALTLAYMPYAGNLHEQVKTAYESGHELIVHMPMEPDDIKHNNPGPDALLSTNTPEENIARLNRNFAKFDGYVIGMNNHMGSRTTSSDAAMRPILQAFKEKGMWFLDSRTIGNSVGGKIANELHIPYAERDVFLDNNENVAAILAQLKQVEAISRHKGYAVAIGHPYNQTIQALQQWLPQVKAAGFKLVPLSTIIAERFPSAVVPKYARTAQNISVAAH